MKKRAFSLGLLFFGLAVFGAGLAKQALANTTYNYTGNAFSNYHCPGSPATKVTASVTFDDTITSDSLNAQLLPNESFGIVSYTVTAFGVSITRTPNDFLNSQLPTNNACIFDFENGQIVDWSVSVRDDKVDNYSVDFGTVGFLGDDPSLYGKGIDIASLELLTTSQEFCGRIENHLGKWTLAPPVQPPGAPTGVSATAGNGQAIVKFKAPAQTKGGSPILGYTVTSSPGDGTDANAGTTSTTHTVTGLQNGTAYTFNVTATNAGGTGPASAPSNQVTPEPPPTVPGPPAIVAVTAGNGQATVSFNLPSNGGSPITRYTVKSNPGNKTGTGAGSPIVVKGLTNGTVYRFTVTATNKIGDGLPSAISDPVTPATVPGAPTKVTATASNGQATINFTPPSNGGNQITSYTVTSSAGGKAASGAGSPIIVTGLTNGTSYTFTVKAKNEIGTGPSSTPSKSVIPATVPGQPTNVKVIASKNRGTVVVTFTPPSPNGRPITGYTVTSATDSSVKKTGTTSPITVTGLTSGKSYTFKARATNAIGDGADSGNSNSVIPN